MFLRGLQDHPTVKPAAMLADALLDITQRGDVVLDPFLGSGSTLVAAEMTGRVWRRDRPALRRHHPPLRSADRQVRNPSRNGRDVRRACRVAPRLTASTYAAIGLVRLESRCEVHTAASVATRHVIELTPAAAPLRRCRLLHIRARNSFTAAHHYRYDPRSPSSGGELATRSFPGRCISWSECELATRWWLSRPGLLKDHHRPSWSGIDFRYMASRECKLTRPLLLPAVLG